MAAITGSANARSWRFARALRRLGAGPATKIVVLVCDLHADDRTVGLEAAHLIGASPIAIHPGAPTGELAMRLASAHRALVLACSDGVDAWRETGIRCRVVGDAPGVLWWRALELQAAPRAS